MFYPPEQFPFLAEVARHFPAIQAEGRRLTGSMDGLALFSPWLFTQDGLLSQGSRSRYLLNLAGMNLRANLERCPAAARAIAHVPGLVSAGFYLLGPQSAIKPHTGAQVRFLRVHLGLVVPDGCALRVADETRAWREGEFLVFDDSFEHEAWNRSDQTRCVFHFDFFHEVPAEEQAAILRRLQTGICEHATAYHAPLMLAGVETEEGFRASMQATVDQAPAGRLEPLGDLIAAHGLFLGY